MSGAASIKGFVAPGFEPVRDVFARHFEEGEELGAGFAAVIAGEPVVELWGGCADRARTRAWSRDTLVPVYSTTKPVAALVVARLVGQGALDFEQPVKDIWPEWGAGKEAVTLAQALSHQAGVPGFLEPIDPALWLDPPALAAALAALPPLWRPGEGSGYHALTWGYIVGEIVRRATGRTTGTILREEICAPLGIDFHLGTPDELGPRIAEIARPNALPDLGEINDATRAAFLSRWAAPDRGGPVWRRVEIPSANGHGTALAVARLYAAFAESGRIEGREIVASAAFEGLTKVWTEGQDRVLPFILRWGAGVLHNTRGAFGPEPAAFGHSGWGGSIGVGDPKRRLSAGYVMNRQSNKLQGDPRALRLLEALYACV